MVPQLTQKLALLNKSTLAITFETDGPRIARQPAARELETY